MFRITATVRTVNGEMQYHVSLYIRRSAELKLCGILDLRRDEWLMFLKLCEERQLEVYVVTTIPAEISETRDAG